ncbi:NAD(P)-dependent oxidoreductase [Falsibacillus pallidus]|uniref:3-hydroxyisobutyrate dehydrogenase n=1 Tax=Falsibacillus pallidus TaxID=493781 RepID=A0A370GWK8_9BACI|nr:NAD(P)-dependent oxidoreductase [Falsibacillus pallidus]RDI47656.1 3-hydroxyisobutyrate dehydrogenase [Falsibacillus pallidus]
MTGKSIAFIGTGVMGKSMIINLLNDGYEVNIYNRTKEKAEDLIEKGAFWCSTPGEAASKSELTITMVGYPSDVKEVYYGKDGILENAAAESILIDMTTSTPTLAKEIYEEAKKRSLVSLDAPVSGGDIGAKNGTLTIMVGGDPEGFDRAMEVLSVVGQNIVLQGGAGSGQHTKMCNQIAIATNMIGVCEALVYAEKSGLDPNKVLESISFGAAGSWSLSNLAPRILKEDFSPGFFIKHFIKDMGIALDEAEKMNLDLPGLKMAKEMYDQLRNAGEENSGTQALYKYWA